MKTEVDFDIAIIGGGIVGLASAYQLTQVRPDISVAVFEKEKSLAQHQTGHNSGVIHSGLYYKPGSVKAETCSRGRKMLVKFAKKHRIKHNICGKLIVATSEQECTRLDRLLERARKNDVEGVEKVDMDTIREMEPECGGMAGLHVPCTGIIDFVAVAQKLSDLVQKANPKNRIFLDHAVQGFDHHDFYTGVQTKQGVFSAQKILNCTGLQSDRIARMDGVDEGMRIVPFRGDYFQLTEEAAYKVRNPIYPVPDPKFPFLGVHFTRTINDHIECGPNAVFAFKREGYQRNAFDLKDTWEALSYRGTRRLFLKHWRYGLSEYVRSLSKARFVKSARRLIPSIQDSDLEPAHCGVRAQAVSDKGETIDDFKIHVKHHVVHVLNAPSPAATACLAIGEYIVNLLEDRFGRI